jgi:alpha/beta superfamily hydrolase
MDIGAQAMNEEVVTFGTARSLVGILHRPQSAPAGDRPAVLLLNAGILHRVGPNRLYVRLARELTRQGFTVLRFDVFGIGDSQDQEAGGGEATFFDDTLEAMDMLRARTGAASFLLMGICMGARIALEVACRDARVASLVLMEGIYTKSLRYHVSRLLDPRKWLRVLTGRNHKMMMLRKKLRRRLAGGSKDKGPGSGGRPSKPLLLEGNLRNCGDALQHLRRRGTDMLLVFRDGNEIAHNYRLRRQGDEIVALGTPPGLRVEFIRFADHTFTPLVSQELLLKTVMNWVRALAAAEPPRLKAAA